MSVKGWAYQESLRGKYELLRDGDIQRVGKERVKFRDIVKECINGICGMRHVGE